MNSLHQMCEASMKKLALWACAGSICIISTLAASNETNQIPDLFAIYAGDHQRSGDLFLRGRQQPRESWRNFREYTQAIERFPNTRSCFPSEIQSLNSTNTLDVREFDWNAMQTKAGAEVCVFRISVALSSPEKVEAWLRYFNFTVLRYEESGRRPIPNSEQGGGRGFVISGRQSLHNSRLLYRGPRFFYKGWWFEYLIRSIFVYEQGIIIIYDNTGSVVGASIYESIL